MFDANHQPKATRCLDTYQDDRLRSRCPPCVDQPIAYVDQISSAVQTDDIREFIDEGWIKAKPIKGTSRVRARARLEQKRKGRRKGQGKRCWYGKRP